MLASWVTAGKASQQLAVRVAELPDFILLKDSIAPLLLTIENVFIFVFRVRFEEAEMEWLKKEKEGVKANQTT